MKVLIIGSGGREHALAWKMSQSEHVTKVFLAPGNGGSDSEPKIENIDITGHDKLIKFAQNNSIELTVVGVVESSVIKPRRFRRPPSKRKNHHPRIATQRPLARLTAPPTLPPTSNRS